ncbi:hypothetical protein RVIR1_12910 [Candidatus Rickettsiella viridis]|uniref:Uncharacterized protein n=1 Tax=Candidatus Rickettsiella viridis TaxID=676208 RepID=A0A2Z5UXF8_9COXI|nr:hypothetical protein RVIR1_12910 [Candidatus Rickettsiella viridis]
MLALFFIYSICVLLAWFNQRRLSIGLFIFFFLATAFVFLHHLTDQLALQF